MTAVQPFSYLTAEPAPLKSAFRKEDDLVETADCAGFRSGDLTAPEDIGHHLGHASPAAPYQQDCQRLQVTLGQAPTESDLSQQNPEGAVYTGSRPDGVVANGYNRMKQRMSPVNDRQNPPETSYAKRPPDVAPKHTKALDLGMTEKLEAANRVGVYGATKAPLDPRAPENTEAIREPALGSASNLYGHINRCREPDVPDIKKVMPHCTPNDYGVPFSYTQPTGSFGVVNYSDMESHNVVLNHNHSPSELDSRTKEHAKVGTTESLNIFDNFILVGPDKSQSKEVALQKEPSKRLKLQELFDPPPPRPPPQPAAYQDPSKVSILGVTNTESCDYRSTIDYSKPKDIERTKAKKLVSTFDNPDYNFQDRAYTRPGVLPVLGEERPWSAVTNNAFDEAENRASSAHRRPSKGRRCVANKLCAAVLITALVTSIVCLGAGFIAGWFGRGKALGV